MLLYFFFKFAYIFFLFFCFFFVFYCNARESKIRYTFSKRKGNKRSSQTEEHFSISQSLWDTTSTPINYTTNQFSSKTSLVKWWLNTELKSYKIDRKSNSSDLFFLCVCVFMWGCVCVWCTRIVSSVTIVIISSTSIVWMVLSV